MAAMSEPFPRVGN